MERFEASSPSETLESRIVKTLTIADNWGYGLRLEDLARMLYGGPEDVDRVRMAAARTTEISEMDGFFVLQGRSDLARKSVGRAASNGVLHRRYEELAEAFSTDLLRHAPFIRIICVAGSLASGGLAKGDDVDFDIVTSPETKYLAYLLGLGLGLWYTIRRGAEFHGRRVRRRLSKVTCMNVIWEEDRTRPFERRDEFLAFELLRTVVFVGAASWSELLRQNAWVRHHFPQLLETPLVDRIQRPSPSGLGLLLLGIASRRRSRRIADVLSRWLTHIPYSIVRYSRRRNLAAAERQRFLQRVKYPYEFFQD